METETQVRLRRAKECLETSKDKETTARKALSDAIEATKTAKERWEKLFMAEEIEEMSRRKKAYNLPTK